MSRAAIYLRVSTDEQRESLDAQERGARQWCERTGASVVAVYRDEGVSGAEWAARAGVQQLRADATAGRCDVVVVRDLDRLGRDAIRLPEFLSHLRDHDVRVVEWSTGQTVELDGMALVVAQLRAGLAQIEREQIAHRVRTALRGKAERGLVVGGEVYGYRRVRSPDGVRYEIDAEQAAIVREVYRRHAEGEGLRVIVRDLNARGVPSPRAGARGTGSWSPGALHEILHRDRYLGVLRWGVTGSRYRGGTRVATAGRDVVEVRDESLRVIDDETWRAVRALDDAARAAADRTPLRRARHLLVGYAVCDACGGPVATARTREGRESVPAYLCAWRRDRGPEVCTARWTRSVARLDALVLDWIGREVLSPEVVADVAAEARRLAAEVPQPTGDLEALRAEERALAATVARLTLALETAPDVPELAARLRSQSDRLRAVRRELATSARPQTPPGLDVAIVEGAARLRDLLTRDTAAAREVLALVLDGRLRVRWEGPRRPVWITGAAELRAESSTQGTPASPEGFGRSLRRVTLHRAA